MNKVSGRNTSIHDGIIEMPNEQIEKPWFKKDLVKIMNQPRKNINELIINTDRQDIVKIEQFKKLEEK